MTTYVRKEKLRVEDAMSDEHMQGIENNAIR